MTSTKTNWLLVALIFVMGLFAAAQFGKISLTLDAVGAAYERDPKAVAYLVSMVGAIGVIFGVVAGSLVSNLGGRRVLLAALVFGAILSALQATLPPLWGMTLLRLAEGFSHLAIVVAAPPAMAAAANDRDRPIVMSLWAMFFGVSFAASAAIFPHILDHGGLRGLFLLHASGLTLVALALYIVMPVQEREPAPVSYIKAHQEAYGAPRIAAPGLGFVFYTITFIALLTFLPGELGRPDLAASLPLISLAGTFLAGWLARTLPPAQIAIAGFALTILFSLTLWAGQVWTVYLLFLAQGLVPGASFAAIPHLNSGVADRARSTGVIAQMGNVGTTAGTPIFALALIVAGMPGLFVTLIAFSAVGIFTVMRLSAAIARAG